MNNNLMFHTNGIFSSITGDTKKKKKEPKVMLTAMMCKKHI